ncbi:hypothetical protein Zmor_019058 [Zophobas morio]|uniref:Serine palmitoyltransferase 1 n=1 Tax=Zophobas morio TaxID=2755281 RepID=A0AA38IDK1_9CUCU|nr:hypothetical protein Zmor_019058 [Zophobas morio]
MFDTALFEERLKNFTPEPLVPVEATPPSETQTVQEDATTIDLTKVNYLNFLNNDEIKKACEDVIREYGVGTCGPPVFYGTTDLHLKLEQSLSEFLQMGSNTALTYSYGLVAISSSIAAFCKEEDFIFADERANAAIEQGLITSRSTVVRFGHNDPNDLRKKAAKNGNKSKKYLIVEGISWTTGKVCRLPEFLEVAEEFHMRIFLDESHSLGVLGANGRGVIEHYNLDPNRVDMVIATFEGAVGSVGGFATGPDYTTIERLRLSSKGFLFSASLPSFLVKAVLKGIELIGDKPKRFAKLAQSVHEFLQECGFDVVSDPEAPFKLIRCESVDLEGQVHHYCRNKGVYFIHNESGLVLNLNIKLLEEPERLQRVFDVLKEASNVFL